MGCLVLGEEFGPCSLGTQGCDACDQCVCHACYRHENEEAPLPCGACAFS